MTLTQEQWDYLKTYWGQVIKNIYPDIEEISDGGGESIGSKLATWRAPYARPSIEQIEAVLINVVIPKIKAEEAAQQIRQTALVDALARLNSSGLTNKTPAQIFDLMQGEIDGWTTLAEAKADLRIWLPLLATAIVWMKKE